MSTEFAGVVKKCPNCGAEIGPYDAICPLCSYVISGKSVNDSVARFKEELEKITLEMNSSMNIFTRKSKAASKRLEVISSFPVPNTVEDISEMIMAVSVMVNSAYLYPSMQNKRKNEEIDNLNMVLEQKLTQLYGKARLSFGATDSFKVVENVYAEAMRKLKMRKRKKLLINLATVVVIAAVVVVVGVFFVKSMNTAISK